MSDLAQKRCIPCEGGAMPLARKDAEALLTETPSWHLNEKGTSIIREYAFRDFVAAMLFVNNVALIAESEGHHPDIFVAYNKVHLSLATHAIGGLSENDFILAAKINSLALE